MAAASRHVAARHDGDAHISESTYEHLGMVLRPVTYEGHSNRLTCL